jgi:hypothetical protein
LDEHFKTYYDLSVQQGQICVRPGVRKNIKAFVQWARDEFRLGRDPGTVAFPINQFSDLIRRYKTHEKYQADSKTLAEAAKPDKFKENVKWEDWKPTFINYIRAIPGRDGVPLKYICRDNDSADPTPHEDFLDDYVAMAPLTGESFAIDSVQVHIFLANFVSGKDTAEAKIQGPTCPMMDAKLLNIWSNIMRASASMPSTYVRRTKSSRRSREKPPHMWWSEFEKRLTRACIPGQQVLKMIATTHQLHWQW